MKNFLTNILEKIIKLAFGLFIIIYSLLNIFLMVYQINNDQFVNNYYHFNFNLISLIQTLLMLVFLYLFLKFFKLDNQKLLMIFLLTILIIGCYWTFSNHQNLLELDDAYNCFYAAKKMAIGDYSPLNFKSYLNMYPHNLGMVSYFIFHLKIFKDYALYTLRITNIIFSLLGYLSLYHISDLLFKNKNINKILLCLMFLTMHLVFYNFYIYANVISYSSALISVYFLLKYFNQHKGLDLILAIAFITLACITKNNSLIVLLAELIFGFIHFLKHKTKLNLFLILSLIFSYYFSVDGIIKIYEHRINYPFAHNKLPKIVWIATGLNYEKEHPGGYNGIIETFHYQNNFDSFYTEKEAIRYINHALDRFKDPKNLITFYTRKLAVSYANNEYDVFGQFRALPLNSINQNIISGHFNWFLKYFWDIVGNIVSIGLIIFLLKLKKMKLNVLLPATIIFGGFLFHLIWEVKAIYLYQYFMYLLPYSAYGLNELFIKFQNFKS